MAGTMGCLLLLVIILLISTVSGVIEVSFEKGVPRLNNSLYCDYYFACHTEGEILQWRVGNNVFNYSGQSTIGKVFDGSVSNCNYTATLLSLKLPSSSRSFKSALILTCQSNFSMPIICSDGSLLKNISVPEKELSLMAETINNIVYLEHVLSQNLVNADNSTCTNVFVCGVNNSFMDVQLGNTLFLFSEFDPIGREYNEVQGTSVQQAILIDKEPYSLVVAMYIVGSEVMNVTCGFSQNITFLSGMQCRPVTTMPETTGIMESESSTVGESSTMASEGGNNLPLIVGVTIVIVVLLFAVAAVIIITIVVCCKCCKTRNKPVPVPIPVQPVPDTIPLLTRHLNELNETEFVEQEKPLRDNNFSGIKKPKKGMSDVPYNEFFKRVQYILLTRNENTFNAATVILTAPDVENTTNEQLTAIEEDVYIGMIGPHPVCLVNETENNFVNKLKDVIIKYFSNAKFLVFVGRCFGIDKNKVNKVELADIVISSGIYYKTTSEAETEFIAPEIQSTFCLYPENVEKFNVTEDREAKYLVGGIVSGVNVLQDPSLRKFALALDDIYGYEETSGELMIFFKNGIDMGNNTTKQIQIITIGAVSGFIDKNTINECDEWQFMASQAAFHYVASKMIKPHAPGKISYEVKKPKPTTDIYKYEEFCMQIKYIISLHHKFDAATTYISAPNINGDTDDIIEIDDCGVFIGMIGPHPVGLLSFQNKLLLESMGNAIINYFPNAKYLVDVGGCYCTDRDKADLGDVLISEEIYDIQYDGIDYYKPVYEMTPEIKNIFCNPQNVDGLELPGDRIAKHIPVQIASGSDIVRDKLMKTLAITSLDISAYGVSGRVILELKEKILELGGLQINIILVNGVMCYQDCEENTEWIFVATQAAFHYVSRKIGLQEVDTAI